MVLIDKVEVTGWESAIRGTRNSFNSWANSDSFVCTGRTTACASCTNKFGEDGECKLPLIGNFVVGYKDLELLTRLGNAGADSHAKGLRYIIVTFDLTASLELWKQIDTYKVATVANSCSTMHKIMAKEFTLQDFSCEHAVKLGVKGMQSIVDMLNKARNIYVDWDKFGVGLEAKGITKDDVWNGLLEMLPESYLQKRTMLMNYQTLKHIYHDRKTHKLEDWHRICDWIATLPYADRLITGEVK